MTTSATLFSLGLELSLHLGAGFEERSEPGTQHDLDHVRPRSALVPRKRIECIDQIGGEAERDRLLVFLSWLGHEQHDCIVPRQCKNVCIASNAHDVLQRNTQRAMVFHMRHHFDAFLAHLQLRRSPHTAATYGYGVMLFLDFLDGKHMADANAVDFRVVEEWMGQVAATGHAASTVNHRLAAVRSFFRWMRRAGHCNADPCGDVERMKVGKRLPKYLTEPEQRTLLASLAVMSADHSRRDHALICTALLTGLRCEELVSLQLRSIDLGTATLRVIGKGDKERELALVPSLVAVLREYLPVRERLLDGKASPWLFVRVRVVSTAGKLCTPRRVDEPLCRQMAFRIVRDHCKTILGRAVSPHMMRHSFATRLRAAGADLQLIQECLGHADIGTTTIYASLATNRRHEQMQQLLGE